MVLVLERAVASSAAEPPACAVTLAVGGGAGPSKTFSLRVGDVLRVGRGAASDFVLALGGISTCHAELFLRPSEGPTSRAAAVGGADLYVRDTSKNGTGVQSSADSAKSISPPKWQALPRGGLARLQNGWKLLLPLRGRPKEAAELAHTLTVGLAAADANDAGGEVTAEESAGGAVVKAKTPQRKPKERKAKARDRSRKRKDEERDDALARSKRRETGDQRQRQTDGLPYPIAEQGQFFRKDEPKKHRRKRRRAEGDREESKEKKERRRRRDEEREG